MKNIIKRMQTKQWEKTLEAFKKLPPPKLEMREKCYHIHFKKIMADDFLFVCDPDQGGCGQIMEVVGSFMYWPEQYVKKTTTVLAWIKENTAKLFKEENAKR